MIKILICSLFALSLISCNNSENPSNPDDSKNGNGTDNKNGDDTSNPKKQYTLVNKTGDDKPVTVVLFSSREEVRKNETECTPVILQNEQCLTITGEQFPLLQITANNKVLCGDIATTCNPDNYEVLKTRSLLVFVNYRLSKLQEEVTDSPGSRKNEKSEEEIAAETTAEEKLSKLEKEAEELINRQKNQSCVPLECNTPEASADSEEEEADEEN